MAEVTQEQERALSVEELGQSLQALEHHHTTTPFGDTREAAQRVRRYIADLENRLAAPLPAAVEDAGQRLERATRSFSDDFAERLREAITLLMGAARRAQTLEMNNAGMAKEWKEKEAERAQAAAAVRLAFAGRDDVWWWMGDGSDKPETLGADHPVVMAASTAAELMKAPAEQEARTAEVEERLRVTQSSLDGCTQRVAWLAGAIRKALDAYALSAPPPMLRELAEALRAKALPAPAGLLGAVEPVVHSMKGWSAALASPSVGATLNVAVTFGQARALLAAYDAAKGGESDVTELDIAVETLAEISVLLQGERASDDTEATDTIPVLVGKAMKDARKYREACERAKDKAGLAKAAHDAWGSDPEGAQIRWVLGLTLDTPPSGPGAAPLAEERGDTLEMLADLLGSNMNAGALASAVRGLQAKAEEADALKEQVATLGAELAEARLEAAEDVLSLTAHSRHVTTVAMELDVVSAFQDVESAVRTVRARSEWAGVLEREVRNQREKNVALKEQVATLGAQLTEERQTHQALVTRHDAALKREEAASDHLHLMGVSSMETLADDFAQLRKERDTATSAIGNALVYLRQLANAGSRMDAEGEAALVSDLDDVLKGLPTRAPELRAAAAPFLAMADRIEDVEKLHTGSPAARVAHICGDFGHYQELTVGDFRRLRDAINAAPAAVSDADLRDLVADGQKLRDAARPFVEVLRECLRTLNGLGVQGPKRGTRWVPLPMMTDAVCIALVDAVDGPPRPLGMVERYSPTWQMPEGCPPLGTADGDFIAVRNALCRSEGAPDYNTAFHALLRLALTGHELEAVRARAKNRARLLRRYLDVDPDPVSGEGLLAVGEWIAEGAGPDSPGPAGGPGDGRWCPEGHRWNTADGELPADERVAVCMRCPATAIRVEETTLQDDVEESSPTLAACRPAGVSHERTRQALTGAYLVLDETEGEERARWAAVLKGLESGLMEDQQATSVPFTSEAFEQWRVHLAELGYNLELYARPSEDGSIRARVLPDTVVPPHPRDELEAGHAELDTAGVHHGTLTIGERVEFLFRRERVAQMAANHHARKGKAAAEDMRSRVKAELLRIRAPWDAIQAVDAVLVEPKGGTRG